MWVDSHCHLQAEIGGHDDDAADAMIGRALDAGVDWMVCVGTDLATSRAAVELATRHSCVYAVVGLHPHEAKHFDAQWPAIEELARSAQRVVGVGEAGFDLYYEHSPRDAQSIAFRAQIELAEELDLALVIHSRDAWDHTFAALETAGVPRRTVLHCFSGGPAEAERALALGCTLSFSGIVSFKTALDLRAAAALTPADRLLVETDSPFLAPVPFRGRTNEPAYVAQVGEALAAARGEPAATVAATTGANAAAVFFR
jgi:TatD DNase family protein